MRLMIAQDIDEVTELIRQGLDARGKTQKQMADHLGFSQKHVSQMLTRKAGLSLSNLFDMCAYLGMSVAIVPDRNKP